MDRLRIAVDGGANRLFDEAPSVLPHLTAELARLALIPDVVKGDFDSARTDVLDFYRAHGSEVIHDSDQDTTDFHKGLAYIASRVDSLQSEAGTATRVPVVASNAFGGRIDHSLASFNMLFQFPQLRLVLLGEESMVQLAPAGRSEVRPGRFEGPHCGVVALSGPAEVSSSGLQWDMSRTRLSFGGLQSTSNLLSDDADTVIIETDLPLVWTTELSHEGLAKALAAGGGGRGVATTTRSEEDDDVADG